jgi:hypothetical protein
MLCLFCSGLCIAPPVEAVQDGRIHIERINGPFLYEHKGSPAEYKAGLDLADLARVASCEAAFCAWDRAARRGPA